MDSRPVCRHFSRSASLSAVQRPADKIQAGADKRAGGHRRGMTGGEPYGCPAAHAGTDRANLLNSPACKVITYSVEILDGSPTFSFFRSIPVILDDWTNRNITAVLAKKWLAGFLLV